MMRKLPFQEYPHVQSNVRHRPEWTMAFASESCAWQLGHRSTCRLELDPPHLGNLDNQPLILQSLLRQGMTIRLDP